MEFKIWNWYITEKTLSLFYCILEGFIKYGGFAQ